MELAIIGMLGWPQILVIAVIVLLLFGGRKIPEMMRGLGGGVKEFKNAVKDEEDQNSSSSSDDKTVEDKSKKSNQS